MIMRWWKAIRENPSLRRNLVTLAVMVVACLALWQVDLLPRQDPQPGRKERARVVEVDNTDLMTIGLVQKGVQALKVEILTGRWKGQVFSASNIVRAQLELDKVFEPGDIILVAVLDDVDPATYTLNAQDHYRIGYTVLLFGLFAVLLVVFGRLTGFNALLSFVFTALVLWKLVIPLCLKGWSAIGVCLVAVVILSAAIIFLVAGLTKKGVTAFIGAIAGVMASAVLAGLFTRLFRINGGVMPYSLALLYSGYEFLSLPNIYIGAIFLSSSGAVMDLAMDVAAGMEEVVLRRPELPRGELLLSGLRIGRSVVGTMTTTLLLAYSGGYLTLMMTFAAQGTSPIDFINNPYVASETVKTIIGSFGLVLVAPLTAVVGALILCRHHKDMTKQDKN
ncbi:MAG: YibE/F family protein [Victivallales bacterium]|nr:YibE/F family protein [Victivallales bacterium]